MSHYSTVGEKDRQIGISNGDSNSSKQHCPRKDIMDDDVLEWEMEEEDIEEIERGLRAVEDENSR
ncbi:hypothetical protein HAX54_015282, partial [Datura stramonium]|nr:hypothetical protein [Datura stramonium]